MPAYFLPSPAAGVGPGAPRPPASDRSRGRTAGVHRRGPARPARPPPRPATARPIYRPVRAPRPRACVTPPSRAHRCACVADSTKTAAAGGPWNATPTRPGSGGGSRSTPAPAVPGALPVAASSGRGVRPRHPPPPLSGRGSWPAARARGRVRACRPTSDVDRHHGATAPLSSSAPDRRTSHALRSRRLPTGLAPSGAASDSVRGPKGRACACVLRLSSTG